MSPSISPVSKKINHICATLIAYWLPVLYFLIATAFYLKTYDSAQIKITLIEIGGVVLLAIWLIKIIESDSFFFKRSLLVIVPLVAYLLSGIFSYWHSPFPYASANELVRRIIYIGIALIVISEINTEEKLRRLMNWLIAATFVVCIYGLIQYLDYKYFPAPPELGLDPFIWRQAFGSRIFSTFGNPNFFGDFLVVMGPVVLALFLRTKSVHLLLLWAMIAFNVTYTYSKGAWLGFAAGLLVFAFLVVGFFFKSRKGNTKKILFIMAAVTMLLVAVGTRHQLKGRPDSSSFRVFTWLSTWEMIKTSPIIGTGIGTYYVTYPSWRRPQIFFIESKHNTETDHPEDEYLEVWYDEGLVGFGIFLLLLGMFLKLGYTNLNYFSSLHPDKKHADIRAYYQLGILTAVAAQLVHNFVCVSLRFVSSGVMLWLMIGLIGAINVNNPLPEKDAPEPGPSPLPLGVRRVLQAMVLLVAGYFVWIFYGYFDADLNHNMAISYSKQGQWDQALDIYKEVARENPSFIMAPYFMGNVYNDRWAAGDGELAIKKYEDVWSLAPNYVQSRHQAGLIYLKGGEDEKTLAEQSLKKGDTRAAQEHESRKKELWRKALIEFERYRKLDPIFPINYYRMAWIYLQLGESDKAESVYKDHLNFPATLQRPPHNAWVEDWSVRRSGEYAETTINLGNIRFMRNDLAGAQKYYEAAIQLNPSAIVAMKNLAIIFGRTGRRDLVEQMWLKIRSIAPQDPDVQKVFHNPPQ
ncbi:MAG: O-antigen ligase family protein [Elusimicrobiota bacterium]